MSRPTSIAVRLGVVALVQLAMVGVAVAPRLSARLTGEEYLLRVQPVDPIDPFRGAYVDLDYPDLGLDDERADDSGAEGPVYVTLRRDGEVWKASGDSRSRPDATPYLRCADRDWRVRCGIESLFLPQDEAREMEQRVATGDAVAVIRVDSRGNAALVRVEAR